jgi:hypothetical protein
MRDDRIAWLAAGMSFHSGPRAGELCGHKASPYILRAREWKCTSLSHPVPPVSQAWILPSSLHFQPLPAHPTTRCLSTCVSRVTVPLMQDDFLQSQPNHLPHSSVCPPTHLSIQATFLNTCVAGAAWGTGSWMGHSHFPQRAHWETDMNDVNRTR